MSSWDDFCDGNAEQRKRIKRGEFVWYGPSPMGVGFGSWALALATPVLPHMRARLAAWQDGARVVKMPAVMIPPSWRGCWGTP